MARPPTPRRRARNPRVLSCDYAYWRDVGTLDAYHHSPMDLVPADPFFNLYNYSWPIHTSARPFRPPSPCSSGRKAPAGC